MNRYASVIALIAVVVSFCVPAVASAQPKVTNMQYWLDADHTKAQTITMPDGAGAVEQTIDLAQYPGFADIVRFPGSIHTLHYRFADSEERWSPVYSRAIVVSEYHLDDARVATEARWWFDTDSDNAATLAIAGDGISATINAAPLREGIHSFNYCLLDSRGGLSAPYSFTFVRLPLGGGKGKGVVSMRYWFDDRSDDAVTIPVKNDEVDIALATDGMSIGLHRLHYQFINRDGDASAPYARMFYRTSPETHIAWYRYWWGDDFAGHTTVAVDPSETAGGEYVLAREFTVPSHIRDLEGGTAELHIMFGDDRGAVAHVQHTEVEYPSYVATELTGIELAVNGEAFADALAVKEGVSYVVDVTAIPADAVIKSLNAVASDSEILDVSDVTGHSFVIRGLMHPASATLTVTADGRDGGSVVRTVEVSVVDNTDTGISEACGQYAFTASCRNGILTVTEPVAGVTVRVYDASGTELARYVSDGTSRDIALARNGIYIVTAGVKSLKVINR